MSPDTLQTPELQQETIIHEIEGLMGLKGLIAKFRYGTCKFILDETPKLFGHVPEIMEAYEKAQAAYEQLACRRSFTYKSETDPWTGETIHREYRRGETDHAYWLTQMHTTVWEPVEKAIYEHFRQKLYPMGVEIAKLAIQPEEIMGLNALLKKFAEREDLDKPYPTADMDRRWNWNRTFGTRLNGQDFEGRMEVSPDSGWKMSFTLMHPENGNKSSGILQLENRQNNSYIGVPAEDGLLSDIYECAESSVRRFYKMREQQQALHSGETYGDMNVFITGAMLGMGAKFSEAYPEDPVAAYALSLDMSMIQSYNRGLSAPEYAAASDITPEELEQIINDPPTFVYHVMRGIIRLFQHMLMEANDEPGILQKLPQMPGTPTAPSDPAICKPQDMATLRIAKTLDMPSEK
jgi:hypothetical protein